MSAPVDLDALDLATLSWLAGSSANEYLLASIRKSGHPQLRISHGYVFQLLIGRPMTIGEIAEGLGVTQQAASKSVTELSGLGYVTLTVDSDDKRVKRVALSDLGQDAVAAARAARRKLQRKLAAELGESSMLQAHRCLVALLKAAGGVADIQRRRVRPPRTV